MSELNQAINTEASAVEVKAPLTKTEKLAARIALLEKRIQDDTAELPKLQAELEAITKLDELGNGAGIVARVGRADTAREVQAVVLGVKVLEDGDKRFKIQYGEGFDVDTAVIQPSQIVAVL